MRLRRFALHLVLVGGLWAADTALAKANMDPESCWNVCWPWNSCSTACLVGSDTWTTCGDAGWQCVPD